MKTHRDPLPHWFQLVVRIGYPSIEAAVTGAITSVVDCLNDPKSRHAIEGIAAILVDPWFAARHTEVDAEVLRHAVGSDLRWIVLPCRREDLGARAATLTRFTPQLAPQAALVALTKDDSVSVLVQRRGHADYVARASLARASKGARTVSPPTAGTLADVDNVIVLPASGGVPVASGWPQPTPF